ncbi:uncharacterized protein LOC5503818 isoform X2 [Nematostella vectensis]|uniref:uncharacterized protein LOC5503818 isoform X2 n=1 Tax=Nematostella vectensis TaxID=45351 RepID=UPI00207782B9|nr:uncharacterized protein LOC5503818 isoform X2 [Nematostella vectensis]
MQSNKSSKLFCMCNTCSMRMVREIEKRLPPGQLPPYVSPVPPSPDHRHTGPPLHASVQPSASNLTLATSSVPSSISYHVPVFGREACRVSSVNQMHSLSRRYEQAVRSWRRGQWRQAPYTRPPQQQPAPTPPWPAAAASPSSPQTSRGAGIAYDHDNLPKLVAVHYVVYMPQSAQSRESVKSEPREEADCSVITLPAKQESTICPTSPVKSDGSSLCDDRNGAWCGGDDEAGRSLLELPGQDEEKGVSPVRACLGDEGDGSRRSVDYKYLKAKLLQQIPPTPVDDEMIPDNTDYYEAGSIEMDPDIASGIQYFTGSWHPGQSNGSLQETATSSRDERETVTSNKEPRGTGSDNTLERRTGTKSTELLESESDKEEKQITENTIKGCSETGINNKTRRNSTETGTNLAADPERVERTVRLAMFSLCRRMEKLKNEIMQETNVEERRAKIAELVKTREKAKQILDKLRAILRTKAGANHRWRVEKRKRFEESWPDTYEGLCEKMRECVTDDETRTTGFVTSEKDCVTRKRIVSDDAQVGKEKKQGFGNEKHAEPTPAKKKRFDEYAAIEAEESTNQCSRKIESRDNHSHAFGEQRCHGDCQADTLASPQSHGNNRVSLNAGSVPNEALHVTSRSQTRDNMNNFPTSPSRKIEKKIKKLRNKRQKLMEAIQRISALQNCPTRESHASQPVTRDVQ